jgi:hypothetical protein
MSDQVRERRRYPDVVPAEAGNQLKMRRIPVFTGMTQSVFSDFVVPAPGMGFILSFTRAFLQH